MTTQQKGKAGELLVQYVFMKHAIDSSPMTTDDGIDLVALLHRGIDRGAKIATVQVKTTEWGNGGTSSTGGVVWAVKKNCPADYIALVDMSRDLFWLVVVPTKTFMANGTRAGESIRWGWNLKRESENMEDKYAAWYMDIAVPALYAKLSGSE